MKLSYNVCRRCNIVHCAMFNNRSKQGNMSYLGWTLVIIFTQLRSDYSNRLHNIGFIEDNVASFL